MQSCTSKMCICALGHNILFLSPSATQKFGNKQGISWLKRRFSRDAGNGWPHTPKARNQHHMASSHMECTGQRKEAQLGTPGALIWRQRQWGWAPPGNSLRVWPGIRMGSWEQLESLAQDQDGFLLGTAWESGPGSGWVCPGNSLRVWPRIRMDSSWEQLESLGQDQDGLVLQLENLGQDQDGLVLGTAWESGPGSGWACPGNSLRIWARIRMDLSWEQLESLGQDQDGLVLGTAWESGPGSGWACPGNSLRVWARIRMGLSWEQLENLGQDQDGLVLGTAWESGPGSGWACPGNSLRVWARIRMGLSWEQLESLGQDQDGLVLGTAWESGPGSGWACPGNSLRVWARIRMDSSWEQLESLGQDQDGLLLGTAWESGPGSGWTPPGNSLRVWARIRMDSSWEQLERLGQDQDGLLLETAWESGPGSGCLESSCRWHMFQMGPKTTMMRVIIMMMMGFRFHDFPYGISEVLQWLQWYVSKEAIIVTAIKVDSGSCWICFGSATLRQICWYWSVVFHVLTNKCVFSFLFSSGLLFLFFSWSS